MATNDKKPNGIKFPYADSTDRLSRYAFNKQLFQGNHFQAFAVQIDDQRYTKNYQQLRYVVSNFAGLISKVSADMMFSEPCVINVKDSQGDQDWIDEFIYESGLESKLYESELSNSYNGDAVFKLRVGYQTPGDENTSVILEQIDPSIYFPHLEPNNTTGDPDIKELAYVMPIGDKKYLYQELHSPGEIEYHAFLMNGDVLAAEVDLAVLGIENLSGLGKIEKTGVNRSLIVHIPNWSDGLSYFGYDDYQDIVSLMYALNNRMTKDENILDKHSDPILALPEGVLDEDGNVKREAFNMFEVPSDGQPGQQKPEYIVWNANMDAAFKQIDKLLDMLYMFSETSPVAFGVGPQGGGKAESGRAMKFRLMRTIHKVRRKRLYYDRAIKEIILLAQMLGAAQSVEYNGQTLKNKPVRPEIQWFDGIPIDSFEQAQEEEIRLASGNTSLLDSIMRLDGLDQEAAQEKLDAIREENIENMKLAASALPTTAPGSSPIASQGSEAASSTKGRDIITPKTGLAPNLEQ